MARFRCYWSQGTATRQWWSSSSLRALFSQTTKINLAGHRFLGLQGEDILMPSSSYLKSMRVMALSFTKKMWILGRLQQLIKKAASTAISVYRGSRILTFITTAVSATMEISIFARIVLQAELFVWMVLTR